MDNNNKDILKMIEQLSPEWREAAIWIIKNIKIVEMLTEDEEISKNELEEMKQNAMKRNDYILVAICECKSILDEKRKIGELLE